MKRCLLFLGVLLLFLASLSRSEQAGNPLSSGDSLGSDFVSYDTPPAPLESPAPEYPEAARKARIQGKVFVKMRLDLDGSVMEARVAKSSDNTDLDQAAVQGAKRYKFTPALYEGKPVRVWITMPFSFALKGQYTLSVLGLCPFKVSSAVTRTTTDSLIAELAKFDNKSWYSLVVDARRDSLLGDSLFQHSELYDSPQYLAEFGKALGVGRVIGGNLCRVDNAYHLNLMLVDVSAGRLGDHWYGRHEGKAEAVPGLIPSLVGDIFNSSADLKLRFVSDTLLGKGFPPDSTRVPRFNEFTYYDVPPFPLKTPHPDYPSAAKNTGKEGTVIVQLLLDTDGSVIQTRVARSSGNPDLDKAAAEGAKKFKFKPAKRRATPVRVWCSMPIVFRLER